MSGKSSEKERSLIEAPQIVDVQMVAPVPEVYGGSYKSGSYKDHSSSSSSSSSSSHSGNRKWKYGPRLYYSIYLIIAGFITWIVALISSYGISAQNSSMQDFKDNWEYLPIIDIKTTPGKCPPGYEELIKRKWPGTKNGCD